MTPAEIEQLRKDEPRTFDARVAEHVHGWTNMRQRRAGEWAGNAPNIQGTSIVPDYADPHADYATLKVVRETWDIHRRVEFHIACREMWEARGYMGSDPWQLYVPGDYSESALQVALSASLSAPKHE